MRTKLYEIYVDSSYDWNKTIDGKGVGEICIVTPKETIRRKVELCFPGLKQLNNRFELLAIEEGLKKIGQRKNFVVYSDSQVAVGWARNPKVCWIPREKNLAGHVFEEDETYPH